MDDIAAPKYYADADCVLTALLSAPDSVRQELAALLSPCRSVNPWRPISTAPKEGYLLGYCPGESKNPRACIIVIWWEEKYSRWHADFACEEDGVKPTYWCYLPAPPSEDKTT
jgi:hypothetical protein